MKTRILPLLFAVCAALGVRANAQTVLRLDANDIWESGFFTSNNKNVFYTAFGTTGTGNLVRDGGGTYTLNGTGQLTLTAPSGGTTRPLILTSAGTAQSSLIQYGDTVGAKFSVGYNKPGSAGMWVVYDDVNTAYRLAVTDTGNVLLGGTTDITGSGGLFVNGRIAVGSTSDLYLSRVAAGVLSLNATPVGVGRFDINCSNASSAGLMFRVNGSRDWLLSASGSQLSLDAGGSNSNFVLTSELTLKVNNTTAATNTTSGALQVAGGVGVAGAIYNGGVVHTTATGTGFQQEVASGQATALSLKQTGIAEWRMMQKASDTSLYLNNGSDVFSINQNGNLTFHSISSGTTITRSSDLVTFNNGVGDNSRLTLSSGVTAGVQSAVAIRDSWNGANNSNGYVKLNVGDGTTSNTELTAATGLVTVRGNLTVNGTGTSSIGGLLTLNGATASRTLNISGGASDAWVSYQITGQEWLAGAELGSKDWRIYDATGSAYKLIVADGATGGVSLKGTGVNDNASAGYVGEYVANTVASGSAVSLTTATAANVTSISLTAGDWDVSGVGGFNLSGATTTQFAAGISTTSATLPGESQMVVQISNFTTTSGTQAPALPTVRLSLNATTTVYLVARSTFSAGTVGGYGTISARRVR